MVEFDNPHKLVYMKPHHLTFLVALEPLSLPSWRHFKQFAHFSTTHQTASC